MTGEGHRGRARAPRRGSHGRVHRVVRRRQVEHRERARGRAAPRHRRDPAGRRARPPHDDPPPARPPRRRPARSTRPGCASSACSTARASRPRSRTSSGGGGSAASRTASIAPSRAAASAPPSRTGTLDADRLDAYRKLEREAQRARLATDAIARRAERKKWTAIHRSVDQHMQPEVRSRPMKGDTRPRRRAPGGRPAVRRSRRRFEPAADLPGAVVLIWRVERRGRPRLVPLGRAARDLLAPRARLRSTATSSSSRTGGAWPAP